MMSVHLVVLVAVGAAAAHQRSRLRRRGCSRARGARSGGCTRSFRSIRSPVTVYLVATAVVVVVVAVDAVVVYLVAVAAGVVV